MGTQKITKDREVKFTPFMVLTFLFAIASTGCSSAAQSAFPDVSDDPSSIAALKDQPVTDPANAQIQFALQTDEPSGSLVETSPSAFTPSPIVTPTSTAEPAAEAVSIGSYLGADLLPLVVFEDPSGEVTSLIFAPDGQTIAFALSDNTVRLMRQDGSGTLLTLEGHTARIRDLAFSPDGSNLASAGEDSTVIIWDTRDGSPVKTLDTSFAGRALAVEYSSDGTQLAIGGHKCFVALYSVWSGILNRTLVQPGCSPKQDGSVDYWSISYSANDSELITAEGQPSGGGGSIQNWTLDPIPYPEIIKGLGLGFSTLAVSPDGETIAAALIGSSKILLIALEDGRILDTLEGHEYRINSINFSPDGRILVSGSADGTVRLWDTRSGLLLRTLEGHNGSINTVAVSPDGSIIASGSDDGRVILWSLRMTEGE